MENNEINEENVNEEVEKKNKKKAIIAIIVIIVIIAIILIALIVNNAIKDTSEIEGEEISNLAEVDLDLTHMGVTEYPTNWSEDVTIYEDKSLEDENGNVITYYVPIPDGYVISSVDTENSVKQGLVIYEGKDEVNDSNVDEAKKIRNQWVWIPVNPSNVYYENKDGVKYSIYYEWDETSTDINEGLKLYTSETTEPWIWEKYNYYHEDNYLDTYYSDEDSVAEIYTEMRQNYDEMIASIEKYGGFYIGRYELGAYGYTNRDYLSWSEGPMPFNPVSMQNQSPYSYLMWPQAYDLCERIFSESDCVKTNMIWNTLWDNMLI